MNNLHPLSHWKQGERVTGMYCGHAYAGRIGAGTRPTPDYRNVIFAVLLDNPIVVYGQLREYIEVHTNSACNSIQVAA